MKESSRGGKRAMLGRVCLGERGGRSERADTQRRAVTSAHELSR